MGQYGFDGVVLGHPLAVLPIGDVVGVGHPHPAEVFGEEPLHHVCTGLVEDRV
jgi:hypothetical protein